MLEDAVRKFIRDTLHLEETPGDKLLAAKIHEVLLRVGQVSAITGISVPTIYRLMKQGSFPRALRLTNSVRAWKLSDVQAWIKSCDREAR